MKNARSFGNMCSHYQAINTNRNYNFFRLNLHVQNNHFNLKLFIIDYSTTAFQESLSKKYNGIYSCTMLKHALKKILLTSSGSH